MNQMEIDSGKQSPRANPGESGATRRGMAKRLIIVTIALVVVFGGIYAWKSFVAAKRAEFLASMSAPAVVVSSTTVTQQNVQSRVSSVGSLSAHQGVEVSTEVPGKVVSINFESGQSVSRGDLLVQLDASAQRAELRALEAERDLAQLDFERSQNLVKRGAVSQAQLDRARSELEDFQAQVEEQQAMIAKTAIRAPFSGELGIRQVNIGQFISPGTEIVTLQSLDPIYANFTLPERFIGQLSVGQIFEADVAAWPGEVFTGTVTAISPKVEETTRNVPMQGTIQNPDKRLRPGMFVQVAVVSGETEQVLTVPRTAVTFYPYGDSVFLISGSGEELIAERRQVTTGRVVDGRVEIVSGLMAGDRVVNTGQLKLQTGQKIKIDDSIAVDSGTVGR